MIRRWVVHPRSDGEVSRDDVGSALMDGEALLCRAGGVLTVLTERAPTGFPGEMVTTGVVFEWKDRTDAKPQPEPSAAPVAAPEPAGAPEPPAPPTSGEPDGLDLGALEDEDVSAIPPSLR